MKIRGDQYWQISHLRAKEIVDTTGRCGVQALPPAGDDEDGLVPAFGTEGPDRRQFRGFDAGDSGGGHSVADAGYLRAE